MKDIPAISALAQPASIPTLPAQLAQQAADAVRELERAVQLAPGDAQLKKVLAAVKNQ